jgi:sugar O-acyltransferase (sialic acid O-acetyltransferase NeuD family)
MDKKVILIGAGGHAKVISDIIVQSGDSIYGFLDDNSEAELYNYDYLGTISNALEISKENEEIEFIIAIGDNHIRKEISQKYKLKYYTAIHPKAIISTSAKIEEGSMIMAAVCINPSASIGKHCIINTGAIIEHENIIEDYVHISPNATLGGMVRISSLTHIGIGAVVKNNIIITNNVIIGAGAVVVKDIVEEGVYIGIPARKK